MRLKTLWLVALVVATPLAAQQREGAVWKLDRQLRELGGQVTELLNQTGVELARVGQQLGGLDLLVSIGDRDLEAVAPAPWNSQDPADSAYRAARAALNRGNFQRAAELFNRVYEKYPRSSYAGDAYYYHAYALYRLGGTSRLREAVELLEAQADQHEDAATRGDARSLRSRIRAELARRGDEEAARRVVEAAEDLASESQGRSRGGRDRSERCGREDDDEKAAALEALLTMDGDRALPILEKIMARRDAGSICLRRRAVFLISQHRGDDAESMLLRAARSDPDSEVRENAVFWLGQSGGETAVSALDSILRGSSDPEVRDKAIFALAQTSSPRAMRILRDFAQQGSAPTGLRENAIFWLGQSSSGENVEFLQTIYRNTREREIKDKIIFAVAQNGKRDGGRWLASIVTDSNEPMDARKSALFWLGQSGGSLSELFALYDRLGDRELRDQMIFVYSQRNEKAAVDKLLEIARSDSDKELKKKALFWLSQSKSKDPRVRQLLEDILSKP